MDIYLSKSDIIPVKKQTLSHSASFSRIKLGTRAIDCYEGTDVARSTIDTLIEKFKIEIKD